LPELLQFLVRFGRPGKVADVEPGQWPDPVHASLTRPVTASPMISR
jgi:hypothetical protein